MARGVRPGNESNAKKNHRGSRCGGVCRENTTTDRRCVNRAIFESKRDRFWPRRENRVGHERSAQRAREVVWTLWKMAAAPYQAQWPLRQIVYFARGDGVSRIAASHLRRRANAPLWPACDPRCQSDVSGRARSLILLPPWPPRCLPKPEVHRGPFHPPFLPRVSRPSPNTPIMAPYISPWSFLFSFLFFFVSKVEQSL